MKARREFLKRSLAVSGAAITGTAALAQAAEKFPAGLIYTKDAPGHWKGKEGLHVPQVMVHEKMIMITTPHPMTEKHFIVKHTLLTSKGVLIGEKTFSNTDAKAESSFDLPEGTKGVLWATSFCNLHDLWLTEFKI
jgi:superoxide reductase